MELLERLRLRTQQANKTAQVDCGGLGVLTVQALPIRECQALAAGPDGDRALLYAACRQLQTAGEQLRREGRLFRPDEIMQLVSDGEARAGAEAVGRLSGLDLGPDGGEDAAEKPTSTPAQEAGQTEEEARPERDDAPLSQRPDRENQMDKIRLHTVQAAYPSGQDSGSEKVRLESVQDFGKQATKIRQNFDRPTEVGQVSRESRGKIGGSGDRPDSSSKQKARTKAPLNRPVYGAEMAPHPPKKESRQGGEADTPTKIKSNSPARERDPLHEIKSELGEAVHEHRAESTPTAAVGLHEIKSELGEELHEIKSEFPAPERDGLHEIKSELREGLPTPGTETLGADRPLPPVTEDLAQQVARVIAEGLRRAAEAR